MITVMLDTNVYCMPFDDLSDENMIKEAAAAYKIFQLSSIEMIEIRASDALFAEIGLISDSLKRSVVTYLIEISTKEKATVNEKVIETADLLHNIVNDYMDSLHIAFAAVSRCDHMITCDKELLKKAGRIESILSQKGFKLELTDPANFLIKLEGQHENN